MKLSVITIAASLLATAVALPLGPILNEETGPILNDEAGPVLNTDGPIINGPKINFKRDGPTLQGPVINGPILNEDETGPVLNEDGPILNDGLTGPVLQCGVPTHPCSLYGSLPPCSPSWHAILDLCMQSGCIQWIRNPKEECPPVPIRGDLES